MKKNLCLFFTCGMLLCGMAVSGSAMALSYSQAVDVSFELNPTISISLSSDDLIIDELAPGNVSDSNTINVNISTNAAFGYTLSANVGNSTSYNTRNLVRSGTENNFASVAIDSSLSSLSTDNTWGFSYKPSGESTSWANYSGLPLFSDTENTKTLIDSTSAFDAQSVQFKIAAKAASTMPAGEYRNVINFIALAKPEPTPAPIACAPDTICYSENALDNIEGDMGDQSATANTSITLLASNYSRVGYGFVGWNTAPDYSGISYGPNEDVTMPADMSNGLSLYAIWVRSSGTLQNWNGCTGFSVGEVTALTDARDNKTYAIAKLADGNCWMIENLRLNNSAGNNSTGTLAQGYNASFIGLAGPESSHFSDSTSDNTLYTITSGVQSKVTISGNNLGFRFPRYNSNNTTSRATIPASVDMNIYSYGNYYSWPAAVADTNDYTDDNTSVTTTSICPSGWRLPVGGNKANATNSDFWNLVVVGLNNGVNPANYNDSSAPYYTGDPEGKNVSSIVRSYPNNFVYSGYYGSSSTSSRGTGGRYWASTVDGHLAYDFSITKNTVYPGTRYNNKYYGFSVRCLKQ